MTHTNPRFVRPLAMVLGLVALTGCGAFPGLEIRVGGEKDEYEQAARHPTQPPPTYVSQPPPPYTTQPVGYPPPAYQPPVCSHCSHPPPPASVPCEQPVPPPPVAPMPPLTPATVAYVH